MDTNKMRELKALAEAAGSDEWYAAGDLRYCDDKTGETHGLHHDDSRFIAAASPATVLALLDEIERLESAKGDPVGSFDKHMEYMQENIRLKAENEDYRSGQDRYEQIIDDLKAENEALRKDAERYRWLTSPAVYNGTLGIADGWIDFEDKIEAQQQIDAAMAKEASHDR